MERTGFFLKIKPAQEVVITGCKDLQKLTFNNYSKD